MDLFIQQPALRRCKGNIVMVCEVLLRFFCYRTRSMQQINRIKTIFSHTLVAKKKSWVRVLKTTNKGCLESIRIGPHRIT